MEKFSKNKKLNKVLNNINDDLKDLGLDEILRYYDEFKGISKDFNLFEYGNMLIYNDDIKDLYKDYKSLKNNSIDYLIKIYKRQIAYVAWKYYIKPYKSNLKDN